MSEPSLPLIGSNLPLGDKTKLSSLFEDNVPAGFECANFNRETPGFARLIFSCDEPATNDKADHLSEPFDVVYWHAKRIDLPNDKTGDLEPAVRLTLIGPEGETLSLVSSGAIDSMDRVRQIFGDGPYNPPLPLLVAPIQTKTKRTLVRLRPAVDLP